MRFAETYYQEMLDGCLYAHRLPIGLLSVIRNVQGSTLREFYEKWYRPQHCSVIAVGHFGGDHADAASKARAVQKVVAMIENCFCQADVVKVPTPLAEKPAEATAFPAHKAPKCIIFKDEEIDSTSISVEYKRRHRPIQSLADYREYIIEDMFISTLNHRLMKIALQEGSPFVNASLSINNPARRGGTGRAE